MIENRSLYLSYLKAFHPTAGKRPIHADSPHDSSSLLYLTPTFYPRKTTFRPKQRNFIPYYDISFHSPNDDCDKTDQMEDVAWDLNHSKNSSDWFSGSNMDRTAGSSISSP